MQKNKLLFAFLGFLSSFIFVFAATSGVAHAQTFDSPAALSWHGSDILISTTDVAGALFCDYTVQSNGILTKTDTYTCDTNFPVTVGVGMDCRDEGSGMCEVTIFNEDPVVGPLPGVSRKLSIDWTDPTGLNPQHTPSAVDGSVDVVIDSSSSVLGGDSGMDQINILVDDGDAGNVYDNYAKGCASANNCILTIPKADLGPGEVFTYYMTARDSAGNVVSTQGSPGTFTVGGGVSFTVGSVSPAGAEETVAQLFTVPIVVGGVLDVISCALHIDGTTEPVVNQSSGLSFGITPCTPAIVNCTGEASYTFPAGKAAGSPYPAFVRCSDSGGNDADGGTRDITVIVPGGACTESCVPIAPGCVAGGGAITPGSCGVGTECCTPPGAGCIGGAPDGTCDAGSGETIVTCPADCGASLPTAGIIPVECPIADCTLVEFINKIIDFIFTISIIVAPIMLVIAGVIFMTSTGNPEKVATARRMLLWTIIGFGIILMSKGLIEVLKGILGI